MAEWSLLSLWLFPYLVVRLFQYFIYIQRGLSTFKFSTVYFIIQLWKNPTLEDCLLCCEIGFPPIQWCLTADNQPLSANLQTSFLPGSSPPTITFYKLFPIFSKCPLTFLQRPNCAEKQYKSWPSPWPGRLHLWPIKHPWSVVHG